MIKLKLEYFSTDHFFIRTRGHLPTGYGGSHVIVIIKEVLFIMMPLIVYLGLKSSLYRK